MNTDELDNIETELHALQGKVTGRTLATVNAALRDIEATRMELIGVALDDLGLSLEAKQAAMIARIHHAGAAKDLSC